jgi:hypothetical protein
LEDLSRELGVAGKACKDRASPLGDLDPSWMSALSDLQRSDTREAAGTLSNLSWMNGGLCLGN